jgi:transcriptional regulator with XRE-family HTH domain
MYYIKTYNKSGKVCEVRIMRNDFGTRVKSLRLEKSKISNKKEWTLQSLACRIGVSSQCLSLIENGKTSNPNMLIIKNLAKEFNVTTDYLILGEASLSNTLILEIPSGYLDISNIKIGLKNK